MKIHNIQSCNFLGARAISTSLSTPVTLFAGRNGAGKSSLQEGVRMALCGESVRAALKKEWPALVSEGADSGYVLVTADTGEYTITLPKGKGKHADIDALPFVLDAQRFASLDDKSRRTFLFGLMGAHLDGKGVSDRLMKRGCNPKMIEQIVPIVRAGVDEAQKYAADKARDAKSAWKQETEGQTWGSDKAEKWQPAIPSIDSESATTKRNNAADKLQETTDALAAANQELGAARATVQVRIRAAQRREELTPKAAKLERIRTKLESDTAELEQLQQKVAELKASELSQNAMPCPCCNEMLVVQNGELVRAGPMAKGTDDDLSRLDEFTRSMSVMQNAVNNDRRDLAEAESAANELNRLDEGVGSTSVDVAALENKVEELNQLRSGWDADLKKYAGIVAQHESRQKKIEEAARIHADVIGWLAISDALQPDGIPGEILSEALNPINDHLRASAEITQWPVVRISAEMQISYGNRAYQLLSESEQWRVDAVIAEAVSHTSGMKLLVLDRFDVLDGQGREDLLFWLDDLAKCGQIDTALIFGTLKSLPNLGNLDSIESIWIENGTAGEEMKEAA